MVKNILPLVVFLFLIQESYSQDFNNNLKKYWYYRERLKYFVVNGDPSNPGMNCVSDIRNARGSSIMTFGQHGINFGYYLGVLSTEYYLLNKQNQNTASVEQQLENALNSYIRLDEAQFGFPWNFTDGEFNGFFMREDVPFDFATNYNNQLNKNLLPNNNVYSVSCGIGFPGYINEVISNDIRNPCYLNDVYDASSGYMSLDEVIGIFMGLALVKRFLPINSYSNTTARLIADMIIKYIRNVDGEHGEKKWRIYKPNGGDILSNSEGGDCTIWSYGYAKAAAFIAAKPVSDYYDEGAFYKTAWQEGQFTAFNPGNSHLMATLAAIGDSWTDASGLINTTGNGIWTITNQEKWHPFYLLLWKVLHDKDNDNFLNDAFLDICSAPEHGPFCLKLENGTVVKTYNGGWASQAKYWHELLSQISGQSDNFFGIYNGLDYMLLYNMYHIAMTELETTPSGFPAYINYTDREVTGIAPHTEILGGSGGAVTFVTAANFEFDAFNKITSDMQISNVDNLGITQTPANVVFKAGEEIDLKPGFTVENGAIFDGIIQSFTCGSLNKSMDTTNNLYDFVINNYDSLFAPYYYSPFDENYVSEVETLKDYKIETPKKDTLTFNNNDIFSMAAYPNPFNNTTTIEYNIPYSSDVNISVFDIYGILIMQAVNTHLEKGQYSNIVNMNNFSKGIYYCKLSSGIQSKTIKLVMSE